MSALGDLLAAELEGCDECRERILPARVLSDPAQVAWLLHAGVALHDSVLRGHLGHPPDFGEILLSQDREAQRLRLIAGPMAGYDMGTQFALLGRIETISSAGSDPYAAALRNTVAYCEELTIDDSLQVLLADAQRIAGRCLRDLFDVPKSAIGQAIIANRDTGHPNDPLLMGIAMIVGWAGWKARFKLA